MIPFNPPTMSNGKTFADEPWWPGQPDHEALQQPVTFDQAAALTWARCWAYGEHESLSIREWHLMWPIVYAALEACARAWPAPVEEPEQSWRRPLPTYPAPGPRRPEVQLHLVYDDTGRALVHEAVLAQLLVDAGWERTR